MTAQGNFIDDLTKIERDEMMADIRGETILLSESSDFRCRYFSYNDRAVHIASLIPLPTMRHPDGRAAVCIPGSEMGRATEDAAKQGVTLSFHSLPDNRKDPNR